MILRLEMGEILRKRGLGLYDLTDVREKR